MKIDHFHSGTAEILAPHGPLTDADGEEFAGLLEAKLEASHPRLVIDMHDVPFIDSQGIELLLDAAGELSSRSAALKLAGVTPTCREIFELTEVAGEFQFFDDVHSAVRSFM